MSKIEEKALKEYPVDMDYRVINGADDAECGKEDRNVSKRLVYVKAYRQALEDVKAALIPRLLPTIKDRDYDDWDGGRDNAFLEIISLIDEQSK